MNKRLAFLITILIVSFVFAPSATLKAMALIAGLLVIALMVTLIFTGAMVWIGMIAACWQAWPTIQRNSKVREQRPKQIANQSAAERAISSERVTSGDFTQGTWGVG